MDTPRNITELKTQVRDYMVKCPHERETVRHLAQTGNNPDLFGWIRLWLTVQQRQGQRFNLDDLFGAW